VSTWIATTCCSNVWGTVGDGYLGPAFHRRFAAGHVLYGSRRTYLRKVAVAPFDGICANTTFVIEPSGEDLLAEFLPFVMVTESFHDHSITRSKGSVNPYVNWRDIADFEFPLPPLDEQRRLCGVLSATQQAAEAWDRTARSALAARRAALQDAMTHDFPRARIGEVATVRNGTTPSRKRTEYWNGSVPWLPTSKVNDRRVRQSEEFITDLALRECSLAVIPAGSVLVAMIGQGKTRGSAAWLELDACINQNFAAISPGDQVDGLYLFHYLDGAYAALRRASQGSNQGALNCRLVSEFEIALPPLSTQRDIAQQLESCEAAEDAARGHADECRSLQRALAQDLIMDGTSGVH
jgi:type I restriction enzyme S subunit